MESHTREPHTATGRYPVTRTEVAVVDGHVFFTLSSSQNVYFAIAYNGITHGDANFFGACYAGVSSARMTNGEDDLFCVSSDQGAWTTNQSGSDNWYRIGGTGTWNVNSFGVTVDNAQ